MNAEYWLDAATDQIRFAPDRKAVRQELQDHLLDRRDAILARDPALSLYQAEQAATEAMGDPRTLAEELGKIHSPLWGYLWRLSQWALAVLLLIFAIPAGVRYFIPDHPSPRAAYHPALPDEVVLHSHLPGEPADRLLQSWEPEGAVDLMGYRFTAPLAYLQYMEPWTEPDGETYGDSYRLTIVLQANTWRFWEPLHPYQDLILRHAATDSSGQAYGRQDLFDQETHADYFCYTYQNFSTTWFEIYLTLPGPEVPVWVEIPVGYGSASLRLDLEKGVLRP